MQSSGRTALVTGGAVSIGRAFAERLTADGVDVIVADIQDPSDTVAAIEAAGQRSLAIDCDVGDEKSVEGWEEVPAYVAAKHGVVGITKVAAIELAPNRIGVNCLCPSGMAGTEMFRDVATRLGKGGHDSGLAKIVPTLPGGHAATPADVAAVATFLLLDAPSTLSGIIVPVDAAGTAG